MWTVKQTHFISSWGDRWQWVQRLLTSSGTQVLAQHMRENAEYGGACLYSSTGKRRQKDDWVCGPANLPHWWAPGNKRPFSQEVTAFMQCHPRLSSGLHTHSYTCVHACLHHTRTPHMHVIGWGLLEQNHERAAHSAYEQKHVISEQSITSHLLHSGFPVWIRNPDRQ